MDLVFRQESLTEIIVEYGKFVYDYWHQSPENHCAEPLNFNWEVYRKLDSDGNLHLTTGRNSTTLIAAALYMIMHDVKRMPKIVATCDTFAVSRNYRGKGIGRQLYAAVEPALIRLGVTEVQNGYREVYNVEPLFPKLGFELEHRMYVKKVG